jgi:hypothetical protein
MAGPGFVRRIPTYSTDSYISRRSLYAGRQRAIVMEVEIKLSPKAHKFLVSAFIVIYIHAQQVVVAVNAE